MNMYQHNMLLYIRNNVLVCIELIFFIQKQFIDLKKNFKFKNQSSI